MLKDSFKIIIVILIACGVLLLSTVVAHSAPQAIFDNYQTTSPSAQTHVDNSNRRFYFKGGTAGYFTVRAISRVVDTDTNNCPGGTQYVNRSLDWRAATQAGDPGHPANPLPTGWTFDRAAFVAAYNTPQASGYNAGAQGVWGSLSTGNAHGRNDVIQTVRYDFTGSAVSTTDIHFTAYQNRRTFSGLVLCSWSGWSTGASDNTTVSLNLVRDTTGPSVGTVDIDLTSMEVRPGTTTVNMSGVMSETMNATQSGFRDMTLQRRYATYSGSCGSWGSWSTLSTGLTSLSNRNETALADGCYQYRVIGYDNVDNESPTNYVSNIMHVQNLSALSFRSLRDVGNSDPDFLMTSYDFPTASIPGIGYNERVRTPPMVIGRNAGSIGPTDTWNAGVEFLSSCTGPGGTLPDSVLHVGNDSPTGWIPVDIAPAFTLLTQAELDSPDFEFRFIPVPGYQQGNYECTLRFRVERVDSGNNIVSTDTHDMDITLHLLAYISIDSIVNVTADVTNNFNPGDPVTSFDFPTQTAANGGKVRSDAFKLVVNSNSEWSADVAMTGPATRVGAPTTTKPINSFGICTGACGSVTNFSGLTPLPIASGVAPSPTSETPSFQFVSHNAAIDAGDYETEFVFTITAD